MRARKGDTLVTGEVVHDVTLESFYEALTDSAGNVLWATDWDEPEPEVTERREPMPHGTVIYDAQVESEDCDETYAASLTWKLYSPVAGAWMDNDSENVYWDCEVISWSTSSRD